MTVIIKNKTEGLNHVRDDYFNNRFYIQTTRKIEIKNVVNVLLIIQ